jgi:hypothetical protein
MGIELTPQQLFIDEQLPLFSVFLYFLAQNAVDVKETDVNH